jgi:hypothetical protein
MCVLTNVPKKLNIFIFETKFIIKPKLNLPDLKLFGQKSIDLFSFQIFFETTKSSVEYRNVPLWVLEHIKTFWFRFDP